MSTYIHSLIYMSMISAHKISYLLLITKVFLRDKLVDNDLRININNILTSKQKTTN